jgi:excisionase family DNA binding protein
VRRSETGKGAESSLPVIHRRFEEFYYPVTTQNRDGVRAGDRAARSDDAHDDRSGGLHGGRSRLLRVAEVAEQLGVCAATLYRLCEGGELPHVRIVNSMRIRPEDLKDFIGGEQEERDMRPRMCNIFGTGRR